MERLGDILITAALSLSLPCLVKDATRGIRLPLLRPALRAESATGKENSPRCKYKLSGGGKNRHLKIAV